MDTPLQLRALLVMTGAIRVEGGSKSRVRSSGRTADKKKVTMTVVQEHTVDPDRQRANVIVTVHSRRLRDRFHLLKTPFGALIDPKDLRGLKECMMEIAQVVAAFNKSTTECQLANCILWEPLAGNRLAAVRGWLAQRQRKDAAVRAALPALLRGASSGVAA